MFRFPHSFDGFRLKYEIRFTIFTLEDSIVSNFWERNYMRPDRIGGKLKMETISCVHNNCIYFGSLKLFQKNFIKYENFLRKELYKI